MSHKIKLSEYEVSEMIWNDISDLESCRTYFFANGGTYHIEHPVMINVKRSNRGDSHRIIDVLGVRHYIPPSWIAFRFNGEWGLSAKMNTS